MTSGAALATLNLQWQTVVGASVFTLWRIDGPGRVLAEFHVASLAFYTALLACDGNQSVPFTVSPNCSTN